MVLLVALEIQDRKSTLSGSLKLDKGFQLRSFMASSISLALIVFSPWNIQLKEYYHIARREDNFNIQKIPDQLNQGQKKNFEN